MSRPESAFAPPPARKPPKVKRDTPDEAAEKRWVRERDRGCVARFVDPHREMWDGAENAPGVRCEGPLEIDHVRASGGLGLKSPTHRSGMVVLCHWHHICKTNYGKTWRPLLTQYLERVEGAE